MTTPAAEYTFPVDIVQLPAKGRVYDLTADEAERAAVAARLGLVGLPRLQAKITLTPAPNGIITIAGTLDADVVQQCVVSLAPVAATIAEEFTLGFTRAALDDDAAAELEISPDDDPPDVLAGDEIDLAELVVEQLALVLDPYPRAPGAVFQNPIKGEPEAGKATISPFAVLAKLKTQNKNN
ncbi:MAG: DUF177 domain-containing protein [Rhodospirillaceae bacterium]|nr:DUF177 domain-containing protein [Rhodospirillaceae bacterium]